ncbi:ATP synthase F0 subunit B [Candidatus Uhrbacteria bacterium RIFCSPHIGHO2_12_FULL_60_25]|uniref:ATP synthase subunit b n=1 Tax=Candidatus Uhrbacteria bacterium RIFCSPHIGHO2_12_FULL_60_25 TaxID=1802399 RepID=A0A1F7UIK4_9BACT|nr:MAG: ATP synthase F0 subunit B [Candidatus Uhrbacteria bacterium RIFCSPHIGHO2_02_FULL_60_44]OGL78099.1 MAG: ATP synthase F0 subunit B [Candidatus Uhrbacteria bacterium RIFCSPHIGHO2_12_FULL_60_25]
MSAEVTQLAAEAAKTDVLGTLGINWKLFLAQLVNVGIVIFVLSKWVFKPLVKLMDDRVKKIDDGLAHAKEADRRLKDAKDKESDLLAQARKESRMMIDEAIVKGEKERSERVERSKQDIDAQVEEAKAKIVQEKVDALEAVRLEVAELVMRATHKVAATAADDAMQRRYVEQALQELEQTKV